MSKRKRKSRPVRLIPTRRQGTNGRTQYPFSIPSHVQITKSTPRKKSFAVPLDKQWERGTPSEVTAIILLRQLKDAGLTTVHRIGYSVYGEMSELQAALREIGV